MIKPVQENNCDTQDIAIKTFFLGPQSENKEWLAVELKSLFNGWFDWRQDKFKADGCAISDKNKQSSYFKEKQAHLHNTVDTLRTRLQQEVPTYSPRYIGHMVSEVSMPALIGHITALLHNPNIICEEAAIVGSKIEEEAISDLLCMLGISGTDGRGHFTSGGTVANIEGLWRARYRLDHFLAMGTWLNNKKHTNMSIIDAAHMGWDKYEELAKEHNPTEAELKQHSFVANSPWEVADKYKDAFGAPFKGGVVLIPGSKHYSWKKAVSMLGLGETSFRGVALDDNGCLCTEDLRKQITIALEAGQPIFSVVSVLGTTELGEIDPVDKVQDILDEFKHEKGVHIWHHVDAAYGGFFAALPKGVMSEEKDQAIRAMSRVNTITLDPHKLGYAPYACGALLARDEENYRTSLFSAPYITSDAAIPRWQRTLEGSRSATGATAMWLNSKTIGLNSDGYGRLLARTIRTREELARRVQEQIPNCYITPMDTNIFCFCIANKGESLKAVNSRSEEIFKRIQDNGNGFYLSKTSLGVKDYPKLINKFTNQWNANVDADHVSLLRVVLMNPFFSSTEMNTDFFEEFINTLKDNVMQKAG